MFIGRKNELAFLNTRYASDKAEFIILYGRRRVGKTELLTEFCKGKPNIFYSCYEYTDKKQFQTFSETLLAFEPKLFRTIQSFSDWNDLFSHLGDFAKDEKLVIVIDEFPYMCKGDKSIPSVLQNLWDHVLKNKNIMLILSGSSISFIEDELLSAKTPLYGRVTGNYKLEPLPYEDAVSFFPAYSDEDKITAYSILGGIPHYLKQFDPSLSIEENVKHNVLTRGTVLFQEVEYILHQELREPAAYNTVLEAIALGSTRFNEISERSMIESSSLSVYLKNLMELGLIRREFPALTSDKQTAKKTQGEYYLADDFFRFWYSFAHPHLADLVRGAQNVIWKNFISGKLHSFTGKTFERVSLEFVRKLNIEEKFPCWYSDIGRWWGKMTFRDENGKPYTQAVEIDVLAADSEKKSYLLGECKFTNEEFDLAQLKALKAKNTFHAEKTQYALFSLNGFTQAVVEAAEADHILLFTLSDLLTEKP